MYSAVFKLHVFLSSLEFANLLIPTQSFSQPVSVGTNTRHPFASLLWSSAKNNIDPVLELPILEARLAITQDDDDDYDQLKERIEHAKTAAEFGVRRAQLQFYEAFGNGDYEAMERVWSQKHPVSCTHPCQARLEGYDAVMNSWKQILSLSSAVSFEDLDEDDSFQIEPARVQMEICGSTAIVSCVEQAGNGDAPPLEALNMYKREEGEWRMTMHMAAPVLPTSGF
jgi:hypothetical protein